MGLEEGGLRRAAADGLGVGDHLVDGHRQRVFVAVERHAEAVADADDVDAGAFGPGRAQDFADGDHRKAFAGGLLRREFRDRELLAGLVQAL